MSRAVTWANAAGLLGAVLLSLGAGLRSTPAPAEDEAARGAQDEVFPRREVRGITQVRDASGVWLELARFERIASASTIADELLLEFCEPERIVAFTEFSQRNEATKHRYAGKPRISALEDLEALLALEPELVLANTLGADQRVARLRERGIRVFDLGETRGLDSFLANARVIATLVGRPELGRRYAERFRRRMQRVAGDAPEAERPRAAYLSVYGTSVMGGGRHTSYDDVLRHAGFQNALADHAGWPELSTEEVLVLDPDLIVTHTGMSEALCSSSVLNRLSACRDRRRAIIEVEPALLSDPGAAMLEATEVVRQRYLDVSSSWGSDADPHPVRNESVRGPAPNPLRAPPGAPTPVGTSHFRPGSEAER